MMTKKTVKTPSKSNHFKDLLLLLAVPVGIALFAAIAVYGPSLFAHPKYDFIYSVCGSYSCKYDFKVDGSGHVVEHSSNRDSYNDVAALVYYDATNNSTRNLTSEEAQQYQLDTSSRSPDGYSLTREESSGGFLFWTSDNAGWYLKDGVKKKHVELSMSGPYYSREVTFLGWVRK